MLSGVALAQSPTDTSIDPNIKTARLSTAEAKRIAFAEAKRQQIPSDWKLEIQFRGSGEDLWWDFSYSGEGPGRHRNILVHDRTKKVKVIPGM